MTAPKTEYYSNQGSSAIRGVSTVALSRMFGIIHTTNGVFLPSAGPKIFSGNQTGAQLMTASILRDLTKAEITYENIKPGEILATVNRNLRTLLPYEEMILNKPAYLPYARFALLFIGNDGKAEIIAGGDCQAIVQMADSSLLWTKNQARDYDIDNYRLIGLLMGEETQKYAATKEMEVKDLNREDIEKIRELMWARFAPQLIIRRNLAINSTFSAFNGNHKATEYWQRLALGNLANIEKVICYSGGYVDIAATQDMGPLAHKIISDYDMHGLKSTVQTAQNMFSLNCRKTHITKREIGVIVIEP